MCDERRIEHLTTQGRRIALGDGVGELLKLGLDVLRGGRPTPRYCIGSA
jgi:hypothetical protein